MRLLKEVRHYIYDYNAHEARITFYKEDDAWIFSKVDFEVGGRKRYDYEDWAMLAEIKKQIDKLNKEINS